MHSVGNAPGSRSPAMPFQLAERCAGARVRPPLTQRVHLGGGMIPTRLCHAKHDAFKAGAPLRVSVAADVTISEADKGEEKQLVSVKKVLDIVFWGGVWTVTASFLFLICGLGIKHSHAVS
jgi:hypothetical protein